MLRPYPGPDSTPVQRPRFSAILPLSVPGGRPYGAGIPWPIPGRASYARAGHGARRRHPLLRLIRLLLVLAVFFLVLQAALNPWIFRIGGKVTPTMSWQGFGTVAASNGGHYVLYTNFNAGLLSGDGNPACSQFGCDNLNGTARLCTASGQTYTFQLTGQVKAWLNTNGSTTSLDITGGVAEAAARRLGGRAARGLARRRTRPRVARQLVHRGVHPARRDQDRDLDRRRGHRDRDAAPRLGGGLPARLLVLVTSPSALVRDDQHARARGGAVNQPQRCLRAAGKQVPAGAEHQRMDHQQYSSIRSAAISRAWGRDDSSRGCQGKTGASRAIYRPPSRSRSAWV